MLESLDVYTIGMEEGEETQWDELERKERESKIKFFDSIGKKSMLDLVDEFKKTISFPGIVDLQSRITMLEIYKKKNRDQLKNEYYENLKQ